MSTDIFRKALVNEAARLSLSIPAEALEALCGYYALLRKWNERIRLVGTVAPERAAVELFADSLAACEFARCLDSATAFGGALSVIDIGSGAGFPGVPAKILRPEWRVTLVESEAKRISFLNTLSRELGLGDVRIVRGRAENLAREPGYRERFALAFCRAVAAPAAACELAVPFVAPGGSFIVQRTVLADPDKEERQLGEIRRVADMIGATIDATKTYPLTSVPGRRMFVQVRKVTPTPERFPRNAKARARKTLS